MSIISPGRGRGIGEAIGGVPADRRRAELPEPLSTVREWSGSWTSPVDSPLEPGSVGMAASGERRDSGLNID